MEDSAIPESGSRLPHAALVQTFRPTMCPKSDIERRLKKAMAAIEKELMAHYPSEQAIPVLFKLREMISGLNYNTHKSSIAIFASPAAGKVTYLDISVEDRVVVDEPFSIRDVVLSKQEANRYLVVQLGSRSCWTYLGEGPHLQLIKSNTSTDKESVEAFLRRMEQGLELLLQAYPLPVFVLGPPSVTTGFAEKNEAAGHMVDFLPLDRPGSDPLELLQVLNPYLSDWRKVAQTFALRLVENADRSGHLARGIHDAETMAFRRHGRLLVVEKAYSAPGPFSAGALPFYIRDSIDSLIQQVLEHGGDVEFVENGALEAHGRIALVLRSHPEFPTRGPGRSWVSQQ